MWFRKKKPPVSWENHPRPEGPWAYGDMPISFMEWKDGSMTQRCHGWWFERPRWGDTVLVRMTSGKTALMRFTNVEWCRDPKDMFFGDIEFERWV